jgi:hypothetical protein
MDKWVKKLAKLGKKFTDPNAAFKNNKAAFLKVTKRSAAEVAVSAEPLIDGSKDVLMEEKKNVTELQQTDNIISGGTSDTQSSAPAEVSADPSPEDMEDTDGTADNKQQEDINTSEIGVSKSAEACPYCNSKEFTKRGTRKNKHQIVQLYECKNEECGRTFTAQDVKGKKFPLNVVIEGMSYYNLGFTLEQSCSFLKQKFNICPEPETLSEWISQYSQLCRYERLRPYAVKMYSPAEMVEVVTMAHRQLFRFRYHRAKTRLMLEEEYRNRRLQPLKEFLDNISSVTLISPWTLASVREAV